MRGPSARAWRRAWSRPRRSRVLREPLWPAREGAAEREEGHERKPALAAELEHVVARAVDHRVAVLHAGDRDEVERLLDVARGDVRQPDVLELALPAQVLERAEHLGERRHVADARLVVEQPQVHEREAVDAERAEVVLDARPQLRRPQRRKPRAAIVAPGADLRDEAQSLRERAERLPDPLRLEVGGVRLRG